MKQEVQDERKCEEQNQRVIAYDKRQIFLHIYIVW